MNENEKMKKETQIRGEILDEALGGIDARFVKAAEDPGAAFAAAGAGRANRPVWLRYAVAAAVTLVLLVAAGFSVFIVNSVIRGSHGEESGTDADSAETADPAAADPRTGEIYNAGCFFPEVSSGKWTGESDAPVSGSLPLFIIDSPEELDGFMTRFKGAFDPDRPREEDGVTFAQGIAGYDAGFFEDNSLVIVLIEATSGGDRFRVGAVVRGGYFEPPQSIENLLSSTGNFTSAVVINIVQTVDGDTDDMGAWLAVIPASKTRLEQEDGRCSAYITWIAG